MRLEDMRLFAKVAEARSFTAAGRFLGMPKQTLSRRISELEAALDVQLLHRTTRWLHLTDVGAAYAERCAEIVRMAEEANQVVTDTKQVPRGVLRVTADPVFGEAFVTGLVVEYARRWPQVQLDVVLTRRRVDMVEEGFDVAFRVGRVDESGLTGTRLGPARVRYCASPAYLTRRGTPRRPEDLRAHECILVVSDGTPVRWPFRDAKGETLLPVSGRLRLNSFEMAREAALGGLGIAIFPEFACAEDLRRKRLVAVLDSFAAEAGSVWLLHPSQRYLAARVRTFVDLAMQRLGKAPPWIVSGR
ncbi:MAG TPA: LysR substrate-binding domain-containing protein [Myxococcaceae bacterium]|nr:LysR substrate-binding domain-containing protein [Myxococcaceae bacterium]